MERVLYNIASLTISIKGPNIDLLERHFSPYRDFKIDDIGDNKIDIEFNIGCDIDKSGFKSVVINNEDRVTFEQYKNAQNNTMMVRAIFNDKEHFVLISEDASKAYTDIVLDNLSSIYLLDRFIVITFICRAVDFNIIKIHASSVYKDGKSIAFTGVSGTGKSTHSRLWMQHIEGADLLNDDEPLVRIMANGDVMLYGAPWSGSTNCFKNISYPLKAIVHLFQAKENKLTRLSLLQSLKTILESISTLKMYDKMEQKQIGIIYSIIEKVPVYRLDCLPDIDAVNHTRRILDDEL